MKGKKLGLGSIVLIIALIFAGGCGQSGVSEKPANNRGTSSGPSERPLVYISGPSGSVFYSYALPQATVLKSSGINVTVQPAVGPGVIPGMLNTGEGNMGTMEAYGLNNAFRGTGEYQGEKSCKSARVLMAGDTLKFGILTTEDTGIRSIKDLKGKRFIFDMPTAPLAIKTGVYELQAYGLDAYKDTVNLKAEDVTRAIQALISRQADAIVASLGGAQLQELATSKNSKPVLLPIEGNDKFDVIKKGMPGIQLTSSEGLPGIPDGIPTIGVPLLVWATAQMSDDTAYKIVKTLIEKQDELTKISVRLKYWGKKDAVRQLGVPYHPGAVRYFKEIGIWDSRMDQYQEKLLKGE